jgi:hypothetical protein
VERRRGCRVPTTSERGGAPAAAGDEHRWELRLPPRSDRPAHAARGRRGWPLTRAGKLAARKRPRGVVAAGTMHYAVAFGKPRAPARVGGHRRATPAAPSRLDVPAGMRQKFRVAAPYFGVGWWWLFGVGGGRFVRAAAGAARLPVRRRRTNRKAAALSLIGISISHTTMVVVMSAFGGRKRG